MMVSKEQSAAAMQKHEYKNTWNGYQTHTHTFLCGSSSAGVSPSIHWGNVTVKAKTTERWLLPPVWKLSTCMQTLV